MHGKNSSLSRRQSRTATSSRAAYSAAGVCVSHCPNEALSLQRDASKGEPLEIFARMEKAANEPKYLAPGSLLTNQMLAVDFLRFQNAGFFSILQRVHPGKLPENPGKVIRIVKARTSGYFLHRTKAKVLLDLPLGVLNPQAVEIVNRGMACETFK